MCGLVLILYPEDWRQVVGTLTLHENFVFEPPTHYLALNHAWSLSIEEQFYLVYPFIILCCAKFRLPLGWALAVLWAGSAAWLVMRHEGFAGEYFHTFGRVQSVVIVLRRSSAGSSRSSLPACMRTARPRRHRDSALHLSN